MAGASELAKMVQQLIDNPELDRYFHADTVPERKPLVIALEGAPGASLDDVRKFGVPVKQRTAEEPGGPVLVVNVEELDEGRTRLSFSYEVEGVAGHAVFSDSSGEPVLTDLSVFEQD